MSIETRIMVATGWVIAIGLVIFCVPLVLAVTGQHCWRKAHRSRGGAHRVRPARPRHRMPGGL